MTDPEFCVTCGQLIPLPERAWPVRFVKQLYCSRRCAQRQQVTLKRLRDTTPPETDPLTPTYHRQDP